MLLKVSKCIVFLTSNRLVYVLLDTSFREYPVDVILEPVLSGHPIS